MSGTTRNAFLGGRLTLMQPKEGYRAGIDPVLLAASVPARAGDSVLELGTGNGVALLCLMARVPGLDAVGVERDPALAALAVENARLNGHPARMAEADLADLPRDLRDRPFDHVMLNPPYFDRSKGSRAEPDREGGRGEDTSLGDWLEVALRRLRPGGHLSLIQRIERLPEVLAPLSGKAGDIAVLPLAPRQGRAAKLFLLHAKKGTNGKFCLLAPLVLHSGAAHVQDGDDYTPEIAEVLRNGAALELADLMNR